MPAVPTVGQTQNNQQITAQSNGREGVGRTEIVASVTHQSPRKWLRWAARAEGCTVARRPRLMAAFSRSRRCTFPPPALSTLSMRSAAGATIGATASAGRAVASRPSAQHALFAALVYGCTGKWRLGQAGCALCGTLAVNAWAQRWEVHGHEVKQLSAPR